MKQKTPTQIGVLLADLGRLNLSALKFLITHLNSAQRAFEYQLLPVDSNDPFVKDLSHGREVDDENAEADADDSEEKAEDSETKPDKFQKKADDFIKRCREYLRKQAEDYELSKKSPALVVLLSLARFKSNYYSIPIDEEGTFWIIALGNWETDMAPPSIIEFFVSLLVGASVSMISDSVQSHLGTKGCISDFTQSLDEVRFMALQGFICSECNAALERDGLSYIGDELKPILNRSWLGKRDDPTSPAGIVANLGYDLFLTRGIQPTPWQRLRAVLEQEAVKTLLLIIGTIIVAAVLAFVGLRER